MKIIMMLALLFTSQIAVADEQVVQTVLNQYSSEGASGFNASAGKVLWNQQHIQKKLGTAVNCATCHSSNLQETGKHIRTGKLIEAMASSVNAERFTDVKKIEKWFLRNCKWTWGRECSAQEKGDLLTFLQSK
ncbi:MAG: DUF1924 domain-containing protein [Mariprofundus sp.]